MWTASFAPARSAPPGRDTRTTSWPFSAIRSETPEPRKPLAPVTRNFIGGGKRGDVRHRHALGRDVLDARLRIQKDSRRIGDVDDPDRRSASFVEWQLLASLGEQPKLVDDGLRFRRGMLDRARAVDDPEPKDGQVEGEARRH